MRVSNPNYDPLFITNAVELLQRTGRSYREVAQELGVPTSTLMYWYNARVPKKKQAKRRAGEVPQVIKREETPAQRIARLERENAALQNRVSVLEEERAILKKATAFFAKESE